MKTSGFTQIDHLTDDTRDIEGIIDMGARRRDEFPGHLLTRLRARRKDDAGPGKTGTERRHDRGGRRHLADRNGMDPDPRHTRHPGSGLLGKKTELGTEALPVFAGKKHPRPVEGDGKDGGNKEQRIVKSRPHEEIPSFQSRSDGKKSAWISVCLFQYHDRRSVARKRGRNRPPHTGPFIIQLASRLKGGQRN